MGSFQGVRSFRANDLMEERLLRLVAFVLVHTIPYAIWPNVSHWVQQEAPGRVNEIVLAGMQGEPVPGNTRPGGSDGATE